MGEVAGDRQELPGNRTHTHSILVEVLEGEMRGRVGQTSEAREARMHLEYPGDIILKFKVVILLAMERIDARDPGENRSKEI